MLYSFAGGRLVPFPEHLFLSWASIIFVLFSDQWVDGWIPFADHSMMNGGTSLSAMASGMSPFGETPGAPAEFGAGVANAYGGANSPAASYVPPGYNPLNPMNAMNPMNPMNAYRSSSGSIGSMSVLQNDHFKTQYFCPSQYSKLL
jgi:hypothetical protein